MARRRRSSSFGTSFLDLLTGLLGTFLILYAIFVSHKPEDAVSSENAGYVFISVVGPGTGLVALNVLVDINGKQCFGHESEAILKSRCQMTISGKMPTTEDVILSFEGNAAKKGILYVFIADWQEALSANANLVNGVNVHVQGLADKSGTSVVKTILPGGYSEDRLRELLADGT